jgi:hypothetical protein
LLNFSLIHARILWQAQSGHKDAIKYEFGYICLAQTACCFAAAGDLVLVLETFAHLTVPGVHEIAHTPPRNNFRATRFDQPELQTRILKSGEGGISYEWKLTVGKAEGSCLYSLDIGGPGAREPRGQQNRDSTCNGVVSPPDRNSSSVAETLALG